MEDEVVKKVEDASPVEERREGLEELIEEGGGIGDEEETTTQEQEETPEEKPDANEERFSRIETQLAEKDAEILWLRGQLNNREAPVKKDEAPLVDIDELTKLITDKDPKVAAKALVELADKISDRKISAIRDETRGLVRGSAAEQNAKESDKNAVLADFEDELKNKQFETVMTQIFHNINREAGRYVKDSLYTAAASAKTILEKRGVFAGRKNGVREVRVQRESPETVLSDTSWMSKAKTIADIPDNLMSRSDKAAARGVAKKWGISEDKWVKNFIEERKNDSHFGT